MIKSYPSVIGGVQCVETSEIDECMNVALKLLFTPGTIAIFDGALVLALKKLSCVYFNYLG